MVEFVGVLLGAFDGIWLRDFEFVAIILLDMVLGGLSNGKSLLQELQSAKELKEICCGKFYWQIQFNLLVNYCKQFWWEIRLNLLENYFECLMDIR